LMPGKTSTADFIAHFPQSGTSYRWIGIPL